MFVLSILVIVVDSRTPTTQICSCRRKLDIIIHSCIFNNILFDQCTTKHAAIFLLLISSIMLTSIFNHHQHKNIRFFCGIMHIHLFFYNKITFNYFFIDIDILCIDFNLYFVSKSSFPF